MAYLVKKPDKKQSLKSANAGGPVTFEKFYDSVEENVKANLLDGKIIRDSPAIPAHGFTMMWVGTLIHNYNELFNLGKVGGGTTTVRLAKYQGPEPDLFFIRKSRTIEFYENQAGEWIEIKPDAQGRLHSKVLLGLWLKTEWFTAHSLPPVLKVLQEILGKDQPII